MLSSVSKFLVDGGYTEEKFAKQVKELLPEAEVEVVKRNERHSFKALPKRFIAWYLWVAPKVSPSALELERKLHTSLEMTVLAFISILLHRY